MVNEVVEAGEGFSDWVEAKALLRVTRGAVNR
jgi:hypothetical protein